MSINDPGMGRIVGAIMVALLAGSFLVGPDAAENGSVVFYSALIGMIAAAYYLVTGLRAYLAFRREG